MIRNVFIILFLSILIMFVSCSKNDPSLNATRLRISITDAPIESREDPIIISEFNVDIQKIEVFASNAADSSEDWYLLDYNNTETHNILSLTNGKTKQLVDQYFPSGILHKLRVTFGANTTVIVNGEIETVVTEEEFITGVEYDLEANLYSNYISNIIIDINATQSLLHNNNGDLLFTPNLRIFSEATTGSLKGYVLPAEADPQVFITNGHEKILAIPEKLDGMFMFKGLSSGVWDIHVLADPLSGFKDTIFSDTIYST